MNDMARELVSVVKEKMIEYDCDYLLKPTENIAL